MRAGEVADLVLRLVRQALVEPPGVDRVGGLAQVVDQVQHPRHRRLHQHDHDEHRRDSEDRHRQPDGVDDALFAVGT